MQKGHHMRQLLFTPLLKRAAEVSAFQDPARIIGQRYVGQRADAGMPVLTLAQALVNSAYGYPYLGHPGIDFAVPIGTPVYAPRDGSIWIGPADGKQGTYLLLSYDDVQMTLAHLSKVAVASSAKVKAGDLVCYSGATGYTEINGKRQPIAAHLHVHVSRASDKAILDAYPHVFPAAEKPKEKEEVIKLGLLKYDEKPKGAFNVTAGIKRTKADAEEVLSRVRSWFPDTCGIEPRTDWPGATKFEIYAGMYLGDLDDAHAIRDRVNTGANFTLEVWS